MWSDKKYEISKHYMEVCLSEALYELDELVDRVCTVDYNDK